MRVVFLHALPFDGRMWAGECDGYGPATWAPDLGVFGTSLDEWAAGVASAIGDEPIVLVGCSVGGSCALEVVRLIPDQVVGVMLVGAKPSVRAQPDLRDDAIRVVESEGLVAAWRRYWEPLFGPQARANGVTETAMRLAVDQTSEPVVAGLRAFHDRRDASDVLASIRCPVLLAGGEHDRVPWQVPGFPAVTVAGAGHYVNLEQPVRFRRLLDDFLAGIR